MATKKVLPPEQWEAIELALEKKTWTAIAKKLGINRRTLWTWRQDPLFQKYLVQAQETLLNEVCIALAEDISISRNTLRKMAKNEKREFDTRVQFESAVKLYELSLHCKDKLNVFEHNRRVVNLEDDNLS